MLFRLGRSNKSLFVPIAIYFIEVKFFRESTWRLANRLLHWEEKAVDSELEQFVDQAVVLAGVSAIESFQ